MSLALTIVRNNFLLFSEETRSSKNGWTCVVAAFDQKSEGSFFFFLIEKNDNQNQPTN